MSREILIARPDVASRNVAPAPPKMSIRHLDFHYGAFHALKDISLDVGERRVTAFKTTPITLAAAKPAAAAKAAEPKASGDGERLETGVPASMQKRRGPPSAAEPIEKPADAEPAPVPAPAPPQ